MLPFPDNFHPRLDQQCHIACLIHKGSKPCTKGEKKSLRAMRTLVKSTKWISRSILQQKSLIPLDKVCYMDYNNVILLVIDQINRNMPNDYKLIIKSVTVCRMEYEFSTKDLLFLPDIISIIRTPKLYTSAFSVNFPNTTYSGAI